MGVTRTPFRDQKLPLPAENWEDMSPKPFGQPSFCSRHVLDLNLVLKESSCHSSQQPRRDSIAAMRFTPDAHSVSAKSLLVQDFCNVALILPWPRVPDRTHLHIWSLPFCGRRLHKEPLYSLPHPQPCSKCHALRVRVLRSQYPGRVEETELSGGLLVDYLIPFCFVLLLSATLGTRALGESQA